MNRKITLVAVAGLAIVAMTASTAFAQSQPLKRGLSDFGDAYVQPAPIGTPDAADRAAAANKQNMLDARERALGTKNGITLSSDFYADGFAQALQPRESRPDPVRDDRFRIGPTNSPVQAASTSSGTEIEWPQLGVGFGVGILLMLGVLLVVRTVRTRPLAH